MKASPFSGHPFFLCLLLALLTSACQTEPTVSDASQTPVSAPTLAPATATSQPAPTATATRIAPTPPPSITAEPLTGGTVLLGLVGVPNTLNPILENSQRFAEVRPLLFDTLLQVDPHTAELQPGLAERWEFSEDGTVVTFHLQPDLKWSDGSPLTASDLATSLQATEHPALRTLTHIRAEDDETLTMSMPTIDCSAVTAISQVPLIPSEAMTATIPMGSGPFVVADWSENRRTVRLERNPYYHQAAPLLDGVQIRFLLPDTVAIALSEGQFDAVGPLPLSALPQRLPLRFIDRSYPDDQMVYLALNFAPDYDAPLNPKVRTALLQAFDREAILQTVLPEDGELLASAFPSHHWAANHDLAPPVYDPEAAQALLREAGLQDRDGDGWLDVGGERLELGVRANGRSPLDQNLAWLISSYYRELGLFARAEVVAFDILIDDLFTHDFVLAVYRWPIPPDPDQSAFWHSTANTRGLGLNITSYTNPKVDALLDEAKAVPGCQPEARGEIYSEIQEILNQDRPVDFLLAPNNHLLTSERLQGLEPGPYAAFTWNITEWTLQED